MPPVDSALLAKDKALSAEDATRNAEHGTRNVYAAALVAWLLTRLLVLVHQGAWPWMNAFVVAAARGIVVGDWNDAVRPQLPAVLGVPLVLVGATEQQTVAVLYVVASLVQFAAFVVLVRALFPGRVEDQALALLVFLLVPFNHSIHHYRDMPVLLASAAIFLLSANFVSAFRVPRSAFRVPRVVPPHQASVVSDDDAPSLTDATRNAERGTQNVLWILAVTFLGIWSRAEVLTFVGMLVLLSLVVWRRQAVRLAVTYTAAAIVVSGSLLLVYRLEGVDLSEALFYQAHTFLDSVPESWLSPECRADPTENCREADGLTYFGPADVHQGVLPMVLGHPLTTLAKTLRSAWDNLWTLFGPNLSTFPGIVPFAVVVVALFQPARRALKQVPRAAWIAAVAVLAETVLPPLTWAPPHPQYHLQLVLPIVIVIVPLLVALARMPRGRLLAVAFLIGNAGLSALRYTRYPGY